MKKHKSIILVGALVVLFTGAFLLGTVYMQYREEQTVQAASKDLENDAELTVDARSEKEAAEQEQIAEESQKNLAEQVKEVENAAGWELSLQFAEKLMEEMPDAPLLQENAKEDYGDSSLENYINDVNAVSDAETKNVIIQVCKDAGIDADTAKVCDLTKEQIAQIDQVVFQNSNHPEN